MNVYKNARLTPRGREILVGRLDRAERPMDVATAIVVSTSTVYKWRRRFPAQGVAGLRDRSSRPLTSPARTADDLEAKVVRFARNAEFIIPSPPRSAFPRQPSVRPYLRRETNSANIRRGSSVV